MPCEKLHEAAGPAGVRPIPRGFRRPRRPGAGGRHGRTAQRGVDAGAQPGIGEGDQRQAAQHAGGAAWLAWPQRQRQPPPAPARPTTCRAAAAPASPRTMTPRRIAHRCAGRRADHAPAPGRGPGPGAGGSGALTARIVRTTLRMPAASPDRETEQREPRRGAERPVEPVTAGEAQHDGEDERQADGAELADGAERARVGRDRHRPQCSLAAPAGWSGHGAAAAARTILAALPGSAWLTSCLATPRGWRGHFPAVAGAARRASAGTGGVCQRGRTRHQPAGQRAGAGRRRRPRGRRAPRGAAGDPGHRADAHRACWSTTAPPPNRPSPTSAPASPASLTALGDLGPVTLITMADRPTLITDYTTNPSLLAAGVGRIFSRPGSGVTAARRRARGLRRPA